MEALHCEQRYKLCQSKPQGEHPTTSLIGNHGHCKEANKGKVAKAIQTSELGTSQQPWKCMCKDSKELGGNLWKDKKKNP